MSAIQRRWSRILGAALGTGLLALFAIFCLPWVRDASRWLWADFLVIGGWAFCTVVAAWLQVSAFWPRSPARGESVEAYKGFLAASTILKSIVIAVVSIVNLLWSNYAAKDFWFGYYSRIGVQATALRSSSRETKLWAVGRVAEWSDPSLLDLIPRLTPLVGDEDEEVRAASIAALGHLVGRMRIAISALNAEGLRGDRFEERVLGLAREALGEVKSKILTTRGKEREAWIYGAGKTGDPSVVSVLAQLLREGNITPGEQAALIEALADIGDASSLRLLLEIMEKDKGPLTLWAIGLVMAKMVEADPTRAQTLEDFQEARRRLIEALPHLDSQALCAFLRWFPKVSDAGFTHAFIRVAKGEVITKRCEGVERRAWFGAPQVVVPKASVLDLLATAIASIALGNEPMVAFLEECVSAPHVLPDLKGRCKTILESVGAGRGG